MQIKTLGLILLINCLAISHSYSQVIYIGTSLGYGGGYFRSLTTFPELSEEPGFKNYEFSGMVSYKAVKPAFSINSGITYHLFSSPDQEVSFLKIPLTLDFQFGKKYMFLFGFGLYGQSFVNSVGKTYYEYTALQAGVNANVGIGYAVNDTYSVFIKMRKDNDFVKLYRRDRLSPGGSEYYENIFAYKYSFNICMYYKLKNSKANIINNQ